jgi:hypothetical protein
VVGGPESVAVVKYDANFVPCPCARMSPSTARPRAMCKRCLETLWYPLTRQGRGLLHCSCKYKVERRVAACGPSGNDDCGPT